MEVGTRPWGYYEVLYDGDDCKVKRITVNPGHRLSLQYHNHRDETWKIISGNGSIIRNTVESSVQTGDVIYVACGTIHRIKNTGQMPLVFVEIQTGTYFGEDDIIRLEDDYERVD